MIIIICTFSLYFTMFFYLFAMEHKDYDNLIAVTFCIGFRDTIIVTEKSIEDISLQTSVQYTWIYKGYTYKRQKANPTRTLFFGGQCLK